MYVIHVVFIREDIVWRRFLDFALNSIKLEAFPHSSRENVIWTLHDSRGTWHLGSCRPTLSSICTGQVFPLKSDPGHHQIAAVGRGPFCRFFDIQITVHAPLCLYALMDFLINGNFLSVRYL